MRSRLPLRTVELFAAAVALHGVVVGAAGAAADGPATSEERPPLVVRSLADHGAGSLREALATAEANPGPDRITFDPGLFADPRTIVLASELPPVASEVTLDGAIPDRLWRATGVTLSGAGRLRVLAVAPGGRLGLRSLTIADGAAEDDGAGIANRGALRVEGVTFRDNASGRDGGAIAQLGGTLSVVNSTFARNRAGGRGGAVALLAGDASLVHCTIAGNRAARGSGVWAGAPLGLANNLLAGSLRTDGGDGFDCVAEADVELPVARNLMQWSAGCGAPIASGDPLLEPLGYFNGPTETMPLRGGSAAINLGTPEDAVDADGEPLIWDQRGNGDPRQVAGYPDLGAFEHQAFPELVVDTAEDSLLRGCTRAGPADCPLRAALELALADPRHSVVRFDPAVFAAPATLSLAAPLPRLTRALTLDAAGTAGITIAADGDFVPLSADPGTAPTLAGVTLLDSAPRP